MQETKTDLELVSSTADVMVDFRDATLVCVEYSEECGFLISKDFSKDETDSSITLCDNCYVSGDGREIKLSSFERVIISCSQGIWSAVDAETVGIIPVQSSIPFPLIPIATHGFKWFQEQIAGGSHLTVWNHLISRFKSCEHPTPPN